MVVCFVGCCAEVDGVGWGVDVNGWRVDGVCMYVYHVFFFFVEIEFLNCYLCVSLWLL